MPRIVQKFGGTSVKDVEHIHKVAKIIAATYEKNKELAVVVSAMGHTTDKLIDLAKQINNDFNPRELDVLLATGEQVSISLLTMALQSLGLKAKSFTGAQAGIITDSKHGYSSILEVRTSSIEKSLAEGEIAVVAGFQGITESGAITTIGRGGSDTTAVALAAALKAEWCDIYTDVNGVYTTDPRNLSSARRLAAISYEEMLELAASGAQVLNARSVELAMNMQVPVRLRSTFEPDDIGTLITNKMSAPSYTVCGIACDTNQVSFNLKIRKRVNKKTTGNNNVELHYLDGVSKLLNRFQKLGIHIDMVTLLGKDDESAPELSFTAHKQSANKVYAEIQMLNQDLGEPDVAVDSEIVKISVVGNGLSARRGLVSAIFDVLSEASVPVKMLSTGDIKVTALVHQNYKDKAIEEIHERFCVYPPTDVRVFAS
jgi:aspartate kinase